MRTFIALGGVAAAALLVGCGDYSADEPKGGGGSSNPTAGSASGGSAGTSVIPGGSAGTAGTGGTSGGAGGTGTAGAGGGSGGGSGGRPQAPEASCENVTACGGEAGGVWFATSSCLPVTGVADLLLLGIGCDKAASKGKLEVTGNLTLGADGMMSDNTQTTGEVVMELEKGCLNVSGTVTNCENIGAPLKSTGFSAVTCVDSTTTEGGCTCTAQIKQSGSAGWLVAFPPSQMGTWKAQGNSFKLQTSDADVDYDYCVEGSFMKATPTTKTVIGTVSGTIVFQKQQ